jgi:uncharacterized membrane protein (DUF373 family)
VRAEHILRLHGGICRVETAIYLVVALLLTTAAAFTIVGTAIDLIEGSGSRRIADAGLFILDRVLLIFIIAELLYTLRAVNFRGQVLVEPFLFIGLIAVVRKVLVVAAEADRQGVAASELLLQLGGFAALALVLAVAIYLVRASEVRT